MKTKILHNCHWIYDDFKQRVRRKEAQEILLNSPTIIFHGKTRELIVKHIGVGIYEIYKKPLNWREK